MNEMNMEKIEEDAFSVKSFEAVVFQNDFDNVDFDNDDSDNGDIDCYYCDINNFDIDNDEIDNGDIDNDANANGDIDNGDDVEESQALIRECSIEIDGVDQEKTGGDQLKKQDNTFENIQSFIQEDILMHEIQQAGIIHGLNNYINSSLAEWKCKSVNVAITGNSGSGKSSLINALRGLTAKSPEAARVGITETTTEVKKYEFPESNKVTLLDLPGIGTQQFTRESYLDDIDFAKFDIVVVVTANRFLENDTWIAEQALSLGKSVIFVRTKLDLDIMNASRDDPENFDEVKCMATIKSDIEENISKCDITDLSEGIYLVSSPDREKYDFSKLSEKLKSLMNTKGIGICKSLLQYLEKAIEEKTEAVRSEFTCKKVASAVFGALPIPKLESMFGTFSAREIRRISLKVFSLDDASLEKVSTEVDIPVDKLKCFHLKAFNTEQLTDIDKLYTETEEIRYTTFMKYSKYLVPIVGSVMSACKSTRVTKECVNIISGIMADDELRLVQLRLRRLEKQLRPL